MQGEARTDNGVNGKADKCGAGGVRVADNTRELSGVRAEAMRGGRETRLEGKADNAGRAG